MTDLEIFTVSNVAETTGVLRQTITRWLEWGDLRGSKSGRMWVLDREQYEAACAKAAAHVARNASTPSSKTRQPFNTPISANSRKSARYEEPALQPLLPDPKQNNGSKLRKFDPVAFMRNGGWQSNEAGVL